MVEPDENLESALAFPARTGLPSAFAPPLPVLALARAKMSFNFASLAETLSELRMFDTEGRMLELGVPGLDSAAMPMPEALLLADIIYNIHTSAAGPMRSLPCIAEYLKRIEQGRV